MPNTQIGRYTIDAELGQGAMGVVYKAVDPLIERTVAIKTIKLDLTEAELKNFEARFQQEAKSAGRLNHPNIVTIYDVGKAGDLAYMAMEYLEGRLLRELLDEHAALGLDRILDIAAQVADALAYAHRNGVVHRDIKPDNIMIVGDGRVKITDFGIAQMPASSATQAGTLLGSPKYMAPEQVTGQRVDGRADIYALGVVLYEMLTGESPFQADNIGALTYRIVHETPISPARLNPKIPEQLAGIAMKALAKDPDARYQDAADMAAELRRCKEMGLTTLRGTTALQPHIEPGPEAGAHLPGHRRADRGNRPWAEAGTRTVMIVPQAQTATARSRHAGLRSMTLLGLPLLLAGIVIALVWQRPVAPKAPTPDAPSPRSRHERPAALIAGAHEQPATRPQRPTGAGHDRAAAPAAKPETPKRVASAAPMTSEGKGMQAGEDGAKAGEALLIVAASPWGEVYVDGQLKGVSPPLREIRLAGGLHQIEIRNLSSPPYSETIKVEANSTLKIKHRFN